MHLADHGVASDTAQFAGDLAGGQPVGPKLLQQLELVRRSKNMSLYPPWECTVPLPIGLRVGRQAETEARSRWRDAGRGEPLRHVVLNVVLNGGDATIWRESGARSGATHFHMFLLLQLVNPQKNVGHCGFCVIGERSDAYRQASEYRRVDTRRPGNKIVSTCRPERRHNSFLAYFRYRRGRSCHRNPICCQPMRGSILLSSGATARGRPRTTVPLSRFCHRHRGQCARPCPSARGRVRSRSGEQGGATSPTCIAFLKASGGRGGSAP